MRELLLTALFENQEPRTWKVTCYFLHPKSTFEWWRVYGFVLNNRSQSSNCSIVKMNHNYGIRNFRAKCSSAFSFSPQGWIANELWSMIGTKWLSVGSLWINYRKISSINYPEWNPWLHGIQRNTKSNTPCLSAGLVICYQLKPRAVSKLIQCEHASAGYIRMCAYIPCN